MVADLHWGKAEIFQRAGIPVSSQMLSDDLARLSELLSQTGSERLILLGDLMHGREGMTEELCRTVAAWRATIAADILFIRGNHDRNIDCPAAWRMDVMSGSYEDGPFRFSHHPETTSDRFTFCGHLHPVIHVGQRNDRLRLPCFWLQKRCGVLPSFGSFTGGAPIRPARGDQILAIAEASVFSLEDS